MKQLFLKIFLFFLSLIVVWELYVFVIDRLAEHMWGINTSNQVNASFKMAMDRDYNCLFLGNSSIYRDINPDMIKGTKSFNFAHDNDAFNQCYYKLKYIYDMGKRIDTLVLGADYTSFSYTSDTRNYIYDKYLDKEYAADYYSNRIDQLISDFKMYFNTKQSLSYLLLNPFVLSKQFDVPFLRDNGQYIKKGKATLEDTVERNEVFLDYQNDYLNRIVKFCEQHDIEIIIVVCPTRDEELLSISEGYRTLVEEKLQDALQPIYSDNYFNFAYDVNFKDYHDYVDICHLNEFAADRFTVYMWNRIKESIIR